MGRAESSLKSKVAVDVGTDRLVTCDKTTAPNHPVLSPSVDRNEAAESAAARANTSTATSTNKTS